MLVILRDNLFVGGRRFRRSPDKRTPVELPDWLEDQLPKSAKIVDADYAAPGGPVDSGPMAMSQMGKGRRMTMPEFLGSAGDGEPEPEPESEPDDVLAKAKAAISSVKPKK